MSEEIEISVMDLKNLLHIIDVVTERGAFKGSELTQVGSVRDKLANFIEKITASEEAEKETDDVNN